jgi:hypothetical protein
MITDLNPYFELQSVEADQSGPQVGPTSRRASPASWSALNRRRAERDSSFERTHGSLWVAGVLDRLTTPLTRYHE